MSIAIVEYGMGNLGSVCRAVEACGGGPVLASRPRDLDGAAAVVLPGVGAFAEGMRNLRQRGLDEALKTWAGRGRPLLGLCLGMQLLAKRGSEGGDTSGLDLIDGEVRRLDPGDGLRIPHVGWNEVDIVRSSPLFAGIPSRKDFYFVHSYELVCGDERDVVATTPYGRPIVSAVARGEVFGVQFHPEKSQHVGLQLLRNFVAYATSGAHRVADAVASPSGR